MPVNSSAGCTASGIAPAAAAGASTSTPNPGAVCSTICPGCQVPVAARPATDVRELGVRNREDDEFAPLDDGRARRGSARRAASPRARSRLASETAEIPTIAWPAPASASAEHRADAAGADDAEPEASGALRGRPCGREHRVPPGCGGAGAAWSGPTAGAGAAAACDCAPRHGCPSGGCGRRPRRNGSRRHLLEQPDPGRRVDRSEARSDGPRDRVEAGGGEAGASARPAPGAARGSAAGPAGRWRGCARRRRAAAGRRRRRRVAGALPGERADPGRPARAADEVVAPAGGHSGRDERPVLLGREPGQHQAEHPGDVRRVAHRQHRRVGLAGRALLARVARRVDADLPPAERAPEQRLQHLDGVDAPGRQRLVAGGEQPEAHPHAVGRPRDGVAERLREPVDVEARRADQARAARRTAATARPLEAPTDQQRGDDEEEHGEPAEQQRSEQAERRDLHDRLRRRRVRVELGRQELVDPPVDEVADGRGAGGGSRCADGRDRPRKRSAGRLRGSARPDASRSTSPRSPSASVDPRYASCTFAS